MNQIESIFRNVQVLELSSVLAGPLVGTFLSECGAKVLKIENAKAGGDVTRSWKTANEDEKELSSYYASCNFNKKTIFLDYSINEQLEQVKVYVGQADIIITNFKLGDDLKWGLDYENLRKIKPDIIYIKISGFGDDDSRTAYDVILQAESGMMSMNGYSDQLPCKLPIAFIDLIAAHNAKEGLLIAMIKKMQTGQGSLVQVSLYDSAISSLINQASLYLNTGEIPKPMGSSHPNIAPYGDVFQCFDNKRILFGIGTDQQFYSLCDVLDIEEDFIKKFQTNLLRVKNRNMLLNVIQDKVLSWKRDDLYFELLHLKVPVARIRNLDEVFEEESAASLLLSERSESGKYFRKPKTIAFKIS